MIIALALDPGRTTGYAYGVKDPTGYYVTCGQEKMSHLDLWHFIKPKIPHIICEDFVLRKVEADIYPVELIGILKMWVEFSSFPVDLYMQKPSIQGEKKAYYSDSKLKDMGIYNPSYEHGRSALKHLLWWFHFGSGSQFDIPGQRPELVDEVWLRKYASL